MTDKELFNLAKQAYQNAYAPYSGTKVGAAILCAEANGKVFTGCNVENASYGMTICAERTALYTAVAAGNQKFSKIAVASNRKGETSPCGACRQSLSEFGTDIKIIWQNNNGKIKTARLKSLLPSPFKK